MLLGKAIERKKQEKRSRIKDAALELFKKKGFGETAIDEIVNSADVAKGTFYLYYKNKQELLEELVSEKSKEILELSVHKSQEQASGTLDSIIDFIDHIIDLLEKDQALLELIYKNLSWGFVQNLVAAAGKDEHLNKLQSVFLACIKSSSNPQRNPEHLLFMILELTSSLAYSAILSSSPCSMQEIRPLLLDSVRRIIQ